MKPAQNQNQDANFAEDLQKPAPNRKLCGIKKSQVTVPNPSNAFIGHAIGLLLAEDVECIVIGADRAACHALIQAFNLKNGNATFSIPVAMVQTKDTHDHQHQGALGSE